MAHVVGLLVLVIATVAAQPLQYNLEQCVSRALPLLGTALDKNAPCCRFKEKYVRPGKPNDDPKSKPEHDDYDPFHLPMPTLKTGASRPCTATLQRVSRSVRLPTDFCPLPALRSAKPTRCCCRADSISAEDAFNAMDTDNDGLVKVRRLGCLLTSFSCGCLQCLTRVRLLLRASKQSQGPEFKGIRETGYFHLPELPVRSRLPASRTVASAPSFEHDGTTGVHVFFVCCASDALPHPPRART